MNKKIVKGGIFIVMVTALALFLGGTLTGQHLKGKKDKIAFTAAKPEKARPELRPARIRSNNSPLHWPHDSYITNQGGVQGSVVPRSSYDLPGLASQYLDEEYANQVLIAYRNGEMLNAETLLIEMIEGSQWGNLSAIHGLVDIYLENDMLGEAMKVLDNATINGATDTTLQIKLADVLNLTNREDDRLKAENIVVEIISSEPDNVDALHTYKAILTNNEVGGDYLTALVGLWGENPTNPTVGVELASEYLNNTDYASAEKVYVEAVLANPNDHDLKRALADVLALEGKADEAIEAYKDYAQKNPGSADAFLQIGNLYLSQKDEDHAMEFYKEAIWVDPEFEGEVIRALSAKSSASAASI